MNYDLLETSEESGQPLELYKFSNNDTAFRYTSALEISPYNSEDYNPLEITRANVAQTTAVDRADLTLKLPRNATIVTEYTQRPPTSAFWLTLFRFHYGDNETKQLWQGKVLGVTLKGDAAEIRLSSIITALNRQGLQPEYQNLCNHYLYDGRGCPVKKILHARAATVTSNDGYTIVVSGLGSYIDDWFAGGFLELADGDQRDILNSDQSSGTLTLTHPIDASSLQAGDLITVYDGCKHRWQEDCIAKFGDETNDGEAFGGFPFDGSRNPFKTGVN